MTTKNKGTLCELVLLVLHRDIHRWIPTVYILYHDPSPGIFQVCRHLCARVRTLLRFELYILLSVYRTEGM